MLEHGLQKWLQFVRKIGSCTDSQGRVLFLGLLSWEEREIMTGQEADGQHNVSCRALSPVKVGVSKELMN